MPLNAIIKVVPSLIVFIVIMSIGSSYNVNSTLTFIGAIAASFGIFIGAVTRG